jgi:GDP-L-fucose synthase
MQKTSKILITGIKGMVGSALKRIMVNQGYTNLLTPLKNELELTNQKEVFEYFENNRPDFVFHLAAKVGGIYANKTFPADFIYQNTQMHCNVFEASLRYGAKKVLFPGSACSYPKFAPQPVKEESFLTGPIEPTNIAYAIAKANGIIMAQSYAKQYNLNVVVPMPVNSYGINDNFDPESGHVIPALMGRFFKAKSDNISEVEIWGSGQILREFLYVDDFADGLIFLMQNYNKPDIINLGTGQEVTILNLAHKIANVVGFKGQIKTTPEKPDGSPRKCLDSSILFSMGWRPKILLDDGLKRMFDFHFS